MMIRLERLLHTPARPTRNLWRALATFAALSRSRRDLARLDAEQRADVGLDVSAARAESMRTVWDIPPHWRNML